MSISVSRSGAGAAFAAGGLLLNLVWCTLVGHAPQFARPLAGFGAAVNPRVFFLLGILLVGIAFAAAPRWLRERGAFIWPAAPLLASFGTLCFVAAPDQGLLPVPVVSAAGLVAFGMGYLWLTAHFILLLARSQSFARMVACVAASLVLEPVAVLALERFMGPGAQVVLVVALPFVSALLFRCARRCVLAVPADGERPVPAPVPPVRRVPAHDPGVRRNACILAATASLLLATVRSLSFVGLWGGAHTSASSGAQSMMSSPLLWGAYAVLLVLFAYAAVILAQRRPLRERFQPALLTIILTLCVSLMLLDDALVAPAVTDTMMRLNDSFSHLLFWVFVVVLLNETSVPSYRAIGASSGLYAAASIVWVLFLGQTNAVGNLIAAAVIYALSWATMRWGAPAAPAAADAAGEADAAPAVPAVPGAGGDAVGDEGRLSGGAPGATVRVRRDVSPAELVTSAIEGRCAQVAGEYGLSPRETEILNLLAQGRTRAYIQEELVLAENTVKTHVAHIYAKLGVRDRQEMIDILLGAREPQR